MNNPNYTGSLDFDFWMNNVPVVIPWGDREFTIWDDNVPNEDQSQPVPPRRRIYIW